MLGEHARTTIPTFTAFSTRRCDRSFISPQLPGVINHSCTYIGTPMAQQPGQQNLGLAALLHLYLRALRLVRKLSIIHGPAVVSLKEQGVGRARVFKLKDYLCNHCP